MFSLPLHFLNVTWPLPIHSTESFDTATVSYHFSCLNLINTFRLTLPLPGFWNPLWIPSGLAFPSHPLPLASRCVCAGRPQRPLLSHLVSSLRSCLCSSLPEERCHHWDSCTYISRTSPDPTPTSLITHGNCVFGTHLTLRSLVLSFKTGHLFICSTHICIVGYKYPLYSNGGQDKGCDGPSSER